MKIEMIGLSECLNVCKNENKSKFFKISDRIPSSTPTLKKDALILHFSAIVKYEDAVTTAITFNEFADGIKSVRNLSSGCSRINIVCDSDFDISLKSHTREARGCEQFFRFTKATKIPKDFQGKFLRHNRNEVALNSFLEVKLLAHDFGGAIVFISVKSKVQCNSTDVKKDIHN